MCLNLTIQILLLILRKQHRLIQLRLWHKVIFITIHSFIHSSFATALFVSLLMGIDTEKKCETLSKIRGETWENCDLRRKPGEGKEKQESLGDIRKSLGWDGGVIK